MRALRLLAVALCASAVALVTGVGPASAAKGGNVTYSGTFVGNVLYEGSGASCPTSNHTDAARGTWSVTLHGTSAKADIDITDHVAFTFPNMKVASPSAATVFSVHGVTGAGLLTITLYPDGGLTYVIAPYDNTGLGLSDPAIVCDRVTYFGALAS
jgi:hypothetical protein